MAEQVQAAMDQMVAPLRDLLDRNIFTQQEIQAIVNRRRESEYLLRRPTARKADFLRYIEAEQLLEKLRKVRTIQRKRDDDQDQKDHDEIDEQNNDDNKKQKKKHIGDIHIIQHIHLLFTRAIRKFRSDLGLHLLYADFAKGQNSFQKLGKIYAEALQIFPRQVGLWIEAASHEYFGPTRSIRGSRILFQRAIRINPTSEELWLEYFTLELHYAQALMGRKRILLSPLGDKDEENPTGNDDNDSSTTDYYKIAAIVLKKALAEVSDNIPFRLRVLDTCQRFPNTDQFVQMIQLSLQQDYSNTPEAWIARAMHYATTTGSADTNSVTGDDDGSDDDLDSTKKRRRTTTMTRMEERAKEVEESSSSSDDDSDDGSENRQEKEENLTKSKKARRVADPVVSVLEEAIDTLRTGDMYVQTLRFVRSYRNGLLHGDNEQEDDDDAERRRRQQRLQETERFLKHLAQVPAHKFSSSDLALDQSDYFESLGQRKDAIRVLKEYCTSVKTTTKTTTAAAPPPPASIWIQWASLVDDERIKKSILQQALVRVPMNNVNYQPLLLQFFGILLSVASQTKSIENKQDSSEDDDENKEDAENSEAILMDTFQRILLLAPGKGIAYKGKEDSIVCGTGVDEAPLLLESTGHACLKYLEHGYNAGGISMARRIYSLVLFQSSTFDNNDSHGGGGNAEHLHHRKDFVDKCLEIETKTKHRRQIFDTAIEIFQGSPWEGTYKKQKRDTVIYQ